MTMTGTRGRNEVRANALSYTRRVWPWAPAAALSRYDVPATLYASAIGPLLGVLGHDDPAPVLVVARRGRLLREAQTVEDHVAFDRPVKVQPLADRPGGGQQVVDGGQVHLREVHGGDVAPCGVLDASGELVAGVRFAAVATIWQLIEERAAATPDRLMFVADDDSRITFGEFRDRAERLAAGLAGLGIGSGTRVTWQLPSRIDTVVTSAALARLDSIQSPVLHLYREKEVGFVLRHTAAEYCISAGEWKGFDYTAMAQRLGRRDRPLSGRAQRG